MTALSSERPKVRKDARYTVTQTCGLLGIHRNTLRRYTERGYIKAHVSGCTGKKFYTGADILAFWEIEY